VDDLEDASAEIMLADDDEAVRMRVGDCFWATGKEAAESKLEEAAAAAQAEYTCVAAVRCCVQLSLRSFDCVAWRGVAWRTGDRVQRGRAAV
jgi:hypothetical protein